MWTLYYVQTSSENEDIYGDAVVTALRTHVVQAAPVSGSLLMRTSGNRTETTRHEEVRGQRPHRAPGHGGGRHSQHLNKAHSSVKNQIVK